MVAMRPSLIYLLGYPGVGKLTVARAIAQKSGAIVVDNQLINLPIMTLFAWDGRAPLPPEIWSQISLIRHAVFETLANLTPRALSYVLTNVLEQTREGHEMFDWVASIAVRREAVFVPVLITCELEEELRRVALAERAERLKTRDAAALREYMSAHPLFIPDHPNVIHVDTTNLQPEDAAIAILTHVATVSGAD